MNGIFVRNDLLEFIINYWNHNNESNIGSGRLNRVLKDNTYVISKCYGRKDLALFNVNEGTTVDGNVVNSSASYQLSLEPDGVRYRDTTEESVKEYIREFIDDFELEIRKQIHFLDWFEQQKIVDMRVEDLISLLNTYKYDNKESKILFEKMNY